MKFATILLLIFAIALGFVVTLIPLLSEEIDQKQEYLKTRSFLNTTLSNNTSTYEKIKIIEHACKYSLYPTNSCIRAMDEVYLP